MDDKTLSHLENNHLICAEENQFEGCFIHVPQGKRAHFYQSTKDYLGFEGLYTEGISTCNILVFFGENRFGLRHIDVQTHLDMLNSAEIKLMSKLNKIGLIYRENEGEFLRDKIMQLFKEESLDQKIIEIKLDKTKDGIMVRLPKSTLEENAIDLPIKYWPIGKRPKNLLRHPEEEKLEAVQKIGQVIGIRAVHLTGIICSKKEVVFDGFCWKPMGDHDLKIDMRHSITQDEMRSIKTNDPLIRVAGKLGGIIQANVNAGIPIQGTIKAISMDVAQYLESYLNDFNHAEKIFIHNMKDLILSKAYQPISTQDSEFKTRFTKMLSEKNVTAIGIIEAMEAFVEKWEETIFKKDILGEFKIFKLHYDKRILYQQLNETNKILFNRLEANTQLAIQYLKKEDYQNATSLFLKIVNDAIASSLADSSKLATACYNYGRCLYRQGYEYDKAEFFLAKASNLIKEYPSKDPHKKIIDETKVTQALKECREKLVSSTGVMPSSENNAYANVFSSYALPGMPTETATHVSAIATSDTNLKPELSRKS